MVSNLIIKKVFLLMIYMAFNIDSHFSFWEKNRRVLAFSRDFDLLETYIGPCFWLATIFAKKSYHRCLPAPMYLFLCYRSSRLEMFCRKVFLKNLAKFLEKHLPWSLFFLGVLLYRIPPVAASFFIEISSILNPKYKSKNKNLKRNSMTSHENNIALQSYFKIFYQACCE